MTLVLADPASIALGWQELGAVMLGAGALLGCALAYNNATRTRYPKGLLVPPPAVVGSTATVIDPEVTAADLKLALAEMEQFYDVQPSELEELIHAAQGHARRRSIGEVLSRRA
jgi:CBS domain-containing membrane protein